MASYGRLPLSFEANHGQTDGSVKFLSRGSGYTLFLTATEAVLALRKSEPRSTTPVGTGQQGSGGLYPSPDPRPRLGRGRKRAAHPSRARKQAGIYPQITQIPQIVIPRSVSDEGPALSAPSAKSADQTSVLRLKLVGANPNPAVLGEDELPGKSNYFLGNDPSQWRTNVPTYAKVRYQDVYPGIDLVYYGEPAPSPGQPGRQLEYDFVVAPGADPRAIRLAIQSVGSPDAASGAGSGTDSLSRLSRAESREAQSRGEGAVPLRIDGRGDLVLEAEGTHPGLPGGQAELRLHQPVIYQEISGARQRIGGNFVIFDATAQEGGREVGFEVARYDATKPLIIDPVLSYSTYLGGSGNDSGSGIAVDSSGNAYVTGWTTSTNFPTANAFQAVYGGAQDAFVTKLNAAGSALVYSTYLGGSGNDTGYGIAVDSSGNAYVTGQTLSTNFPTANAFQATNGGGRDAFVTKLNVAGSALVYSTYLGGSGGEAGSGIAVDSSGNAYVTGYTQANTFPTVNAFQAAYGGNQDAFVTKLNAEGSALVYSTYLGGRGTDQGNGIAVDSSGNAYGTGWTQSPNFPTANAFQAALSSFQNAFVTKLNAAGLALAYSTYLGGSDNDWGYGIAVDSSDNAYVTGSTQSTNFPTTPGVFQTTGGGCFVTKFNPADTALAYSTLINNGGCRGIAVDSSGNAFVTGETTSRNFPTANAFQAAFGGAFDAFVTKLNAAGSALVYSTYLGGSNTESVYGIAVDPSGNAYVTGQTFSTNFPTANAFQATFRGGIDAFVTKFPALTAGALPPPQLTQGAVVNGASFAAGAPVAPGSILSIFGFNLAPSAVEAGSTPLPTGLLTTSVTINGVPIPLYYVSPTQINAQVPFETPPGTATLAVTVNGALSPAVTLPVAATAPGIFLYGANRAVAQNPDGSINASNNPARPGDAIVLYMTGQGAVSNPVPTGAPALANPQSLTLATTTATIGGANTQVLFSGLAPGFVGLLQVNIRIPTVAAGDRSLVVTIGGAASNSALITVASP